ncbi:MAG: alpha/beta hydrolase [Alphaproteobacteria bacterium]|nr:alpha/beta hydrolase [Alphaproteobacteria bacterium]
MALDPQIAAVLEAAAKAGRPLLQTLSPDEARKMFRETRVPLQPPPPEMARVDDLVADAGHGKIPLRHFRPKGHPENELVPALLYFHGGGWVIGDLDTHDITCRQLAEASGCAVLSVNYRKAPEHRFPAAIDDAYAIATWLTANGGSLRIDGHRLAVGGDSAGGSLAAALALMARDALASGRNAPSFRLQLLIYPATDMTMAHDSLNRFADGYLLTRAAMAWFIDHYMGSADRRDPRASPLLASSLKDLPPAYVITAGFDPLRDEGFAYARKLAEAGNTVEYVEYGGMVHGFLGMGGVIATANRAVAAAGAALKQALSD